MALTSELKPWERGRKFPKHSDHHRNFPGKTIRISDEMFSKLGEYRKVRTDGYYETWSQALERALDLAETTLEVHKLANHIKAGNHETVPV